VGRRKAVVVWRATIDAGGVEAWVVFAATRLRGHWSRAENISAEKRWRSEPEGSDPQVAITRRGEAVAMWTAGDEGHSTTSFIRSATQARGGRSWAAPIGIRGSIEGQEPQLGVTPRGEAVAIWHAFYNEESGVEVASRPEGGKWSRVERLSNPGAFPDPRIAITPKGEAVAAWELDEDPRLQVATRKAGARWKVQTLAGGGGDFVGPQIVTEPGGKATVFWNRSRGSDEDEVLAATHFPGGTWTEPASLFGGGFEERPEIAVTRSGEWIAVWATRNPVSGESIIQSSSHDRGQPWGPPVNLTSSPPAPLFGAFEPRIAIAPSGEAFAVWRCYDGANWVIQAATRTP